VLALVWAMGRNRVIGAGNALPWRLPADLAHFKALTTGHPVVMGRKTYESLGRPLPNRTNIVMSRDPSFRPAGCNVVDSVDAALAMASRHADPSNPLVFVMGGADLYRQALPLADRLYPTLVDCEVDGDAWFPDFDWGAWTVTEQRRHAADDRNAYACTFLTLERKTPRS